MSVVVIALTLSSTVTSYAWDGSINYNGVLRPQAIVRTPAGVYSTPAEANKVYTYFTGAQSTSSRSSASYTGSSLTGVKSLAFVFGGTTYTDWDITLPYFESYWYYLSQYGHEYASARSTFRDSYYKLNYNGHVWVTLSFSAFSRATDQQHANGISHNLNTFTYGTILTNDGFYLAGTDTYTPYIIDVMQYMYTTSDYTAINGDNLAGGDYYSWMVDNIKLSFDSTSFPRDYPTSSSVEIGLASLSGTRYQAYIEAICTSFYGASPEYLTQRLNELYDEYVRILRANETLESVNAQLRETIELLQAEIRELHTDIRVAYENGYSDGYSDGHEVGITSRFGGVDWLLDCADSFLGLTLFEANGYAFTLRTLLSVTVGSMALIWILKIFAGG